MVFEMPEEISGQKNRKVLCRGGVIRSKGANAKEKAKPEPGENSSAEPVSLAASIVDYKFIQ
jgi:hypothetical protein